MRIPLSFGVVSATQVAVAPAGGADRPAWRHAHCPETRTTGRVNNWLANLFRSHRRDLVRCASRLIGDRDGGEEVVQDTWLRLAKRTAQIEYPKA